MLAPVSGKAIEHTTKHIEKRRGISAPTLLVIVMPTTARRKPVEPPRQKVIPDNYDLSSAKRILTPTNTTVGLRVALSYDFFIKLPGNRHGTPLHPKLNFQ
jgi:hypothetical protein